MKVEKTIKLNSGFDMPTVGLGTWTMWQNPDGVMEKVIKEAVSVGYRHIDTAQNYETEPMIGTALTDLFKSGDITREDIFITSKVWCTNHRAEDVRRSVAQSLKDLQTSYLDLLLIHFPMAYKPGKEIMPKDENGKLIYHDVDYLETWKAMEELVEQGQVRSIGLSNFNVKQIKRVSGVAKIQPANLQVELNAYMANKELADFCGEKGIVVSCFAPFGNPARLWKQDGEPNLLDDGVVKAMSEKYERTGAQVLLRHLLQKGYVVLPKTVTTSRLKENLSVFDFNLDDEDMSKLDKLNQNLRYYSEPTAFDSPYYPYKEDAI